MCSLNSNALYIIALTLLGLTACHPKTTEVSVPAAKHEKHFKPGANVRIQSDSIIIVKSGEIINTNIVLTTSESSGRLLIDFSCSEGLELFDTPKQINAELNETKLVTVPVKLRAIQDGRFYLYLQATINSGESVSSRSLALIVQAGPELQKTRQFEKPGDQNIISMPAQETHSTP